MVDKLIFAFAGNSSVGSLYALRWAIEDYRPRPLDLEEYSHFGVIARYLAGASNLPFYPVRSYAGSDIAAHNPNIAKVRSPYLGEDGEPEEIHVVPPIKPGVGYYDRDNDFYRSWSGISKDPAVLERWLQEWIHDLPDHQAYLKKLGEGKRRVFAGIGLPTLAVALSQATTNPSIEQVYESGVCGAHPPRLPETIADAPLATGAETIFPTRTTLGTADAQSWKGSRRSSD